MKLGSSTLRNLIYAREARSKRFASWDLKGRNRDALHVKPGETGRHEIIIPLATLGTVEVAWLGDADADRLHWALTVRSENVIYTFASPNYPPIKAKALAEPMADVPIGHRILVLRTSDYCGYKESKSREGDSLFKFDPSQAGSVSGTVHLPSGDPAEGVRVKLLHPMLAEFGPVRGMASTMGIGPGPLVGATRTAEDGTFRFPRVAPGRYTVRPGPLPSPRVQSSLVVREGATTVVELTASTGKEDRGRKAGGNASGSAGIEQRTERVLAMIDSLDGFAATEQVEHAGIGLLPRIVSVAFSGIFESRDIGAAGAPAPPPKVITTVTEVITALRQEPHLRELKVDRFSSFTDKDLVNIGHLISLGELTITEPGITDQTGRLIGSLTSLRCLDLSFTKVSDETLSVVSGLVELERLTIAGTDITDAGVAQLSGLKKLVHFEARSTKITDASMETIASWPELQALRISGTAVTTEGLARLRTAKKLRSLWLSRTGTNDAGLAVLSQLASLTSLGLRNTKTTDAGLAHLGRMTNMRALDLAYTSITDKGMAHIAGLTNLIALDVSYTNITSAGLEHVEGMIELDKLYFSGTAVDDNFVAHIAHLPRLRLLSISGCNVTPAVFTKMMHMTTIEQFYIHNEALMSSPQAKAFVESNGRPGVLR